jgi:hypothetical protein
VSDPTTVLIGPILDRLGHAQQTRRTQGHFGLELRHETFWATSGDELRPVQPNIIPVRIGHQEIIGELVHLERNASGTVYGVAVVDPEIPTDAVIFFSAETDSNSDGTDVVLEGAGLVTESAQVALRPVRVLRGRLDRAEERSRWGLDAFGGDRAMIERAVVAYTRQQRQRGPHYIYDATARKAVVAASVRPGSSWRHEPQPRIEIRPATIVSVT